MEDVGFVCGGEGVGQGMTHGGWRVGRGRAVEISAEGLEEAGGGGGREDGSEEVEGVGMGEEFGEGAGGLVAAGVEEGESVAAGMDFGETAGGEEDGFSLGCEGGEELFEVGAGGGFKAGEGGVEEEEVGFSNEGVGEQGAALGGALDWVGGGAGARGRG